MKKLLLIKLGGSLVTDKGQERTAKAEIISRLAQEILSARKRFKGDIILAHGSGSFAHTVASKYETQKGLINKNSFLGLPLVADVAIQFNRIIISKLLATQIPAVSFSPSSFILSEKQKTKSVYLEPLIHALSLGYLPVLYGDIIFDKYQGFCIYSTEKILSLLAQKLSPQYDKVSLLFCGDSDGVYDDQQKTIPLITPRSFAHLKKFIGGSSKTDVTGGMLHKVEESLLLAKKGFSTLIINGHQKGELSRAILGQKHTGTLITSI